jgi:hypothetical protein
MEKKINESTTSSSDGVFKGKLNITPRVWKNEQLIPIRRKFRVISIMEPPLIRMMVR